MNQAQKYHIGIKEAMVNFFIIIIIICTFIYNKEVYLVKINIQVIQSVCTAYIIIVKSVEIWYKK